MKVQFRGSFAKDLKKIHNPELLKEIGDAIRHVEQARTSQDVVNLKKLKGAGNYFRIRVGNYRLGLIVAGDVVTFVRCLDRKEMYRFFP